MHIPFFNPIAVNAPYKQALTDAFERVMASGQLVLGKEVEKFEKNYAAYIGVKHCIGVSNGLDALVLSLKACGIGAGDEVVVPAHTYTATWMAVELAGAKPVGADAMGPDYDMDEGTFGAAISPKTKAVIPVHLYGMPAPINELQQVANLHNIIVIEDNAQAAGASINGKKTGSFGLANAHSFYPTKTLGALGDAGAITTNDDGIASRLRQLRNYGSTQKNIHNTLGHNCRLDELQAAFLNVKLPILDAANAERQQLASLYNSYFKDIDTPGFYYPGRFPNTAYNHVHHLYVIRCEKRNELQKYLTQQGIETAIHYPTPPHLQPAFAHLGYTKGSFATAEYLAQTVLTLPLYNGLPASSVEYIANHIRQFLSYGKL